MVTDRRGKLHLVCSRRELLRVGGGLALSSLVLPRRLRGATSGAKSCILVYLLGGPPHLDTFDLKPEAPLEIRGPFRPIPTTVPGLQICEHLPRLARLAHRYAIVRSVSHRNSNHTPMIYYTLTGRDTEQPTMDNDVRPPERTDFPCLGAMVARFKPSHAHLPGCVAIPEVAVRSSTSGEYKRARIPLRGGGAGFLGPQYEPLVVEGEPGTRDAVPAIALPDGITPHRFAARAAMLSLLDGSRRSGAAGDELHTLRERAVLMTGAAHKGLSPPFSLEREPERLRDRYGRHRFGQSMLLARRLAEAGVPFLAIHFNEMTVCDGWDTHSKNFEALQTELLPYLDQSLSALIEDLDVRGLLEQTLIIVMGEFGRTPKINAQGGRDHWGECSSTLLAGGGIRGGAVLGASDRHGAFPVESPVDPIDIHATMFHCLGMDPGSSIHDQLGRPHTLSQGRVIRELLA